MNQRRHLTVIAAVTTLMAAAPLSGLFIQWTWMIEAIIAVSLICAAALVARALRAPVWAQPIATLFALLLGLTWLSANAHALGGLLPTLDTFRHFGSLLSNAGTDMNVYSVPVDDRPGFLFLSTAGVGFVAILVDLLAVGLRRPALAGLPMLAIYAVPVEINPGSVSVIAFAIGAAGFMWLLVTDNIDRVRLFGRRFTGEGRGVDMWEPSPLATVGRRIALIGMLLAIVIPIATPGLGRGLIPALGGGAGTGNGTGTCRGTCMNGSVNLFANLEGQLNDTTTTVLATVKTDGNEFPEYLRFGVADTLTKNGFAPSSPSGHPISQGLPNPPFTNTNGLGAGQVDFTKHTATVTIKGLRLPMLPVYLAPKTGSTTGIPDGYYFDPDTAVIFSNKSTTAGQTYSFTYDQPDYGQGDALRGAPGLTPTDPMEVAYGRPPTEVAKVSQIVDEQTKGATNEYDIVMRLYDYFSRDNGFSYQLTTKAGTTGTEIGNFLQQKQGYCVQYAAALAWLVRQAGFPSRVAFGFTQGTPVSGSPNTFQLTNQNLHAWTEVYFPTFGWVPFDATPGADVPGSIRTAWAPDANTVQPTGPEPQLSHKPGTTGDGPSNKPSTDGTGPTVRAQHHGSNSTPIWAWWLLIGFGVALALTALPMLARLLLRSRRAAADRRVTSDSAAPGEPFVVIDESATRDASRRRVHAAWDEFIDILVDYRIPVNAAETPRTTSERVVRTLEFSGDAETSTRLIGSSEERARYARRPGPGQPLEDGLRTIRRTLAGRVSLRTRLRAQLLPPSVTQRWAAATVSTIGNTVAAAQTLRESIGRLFSFRRRLSPRRLMAERSSR